MKEKVRKDLRDAFEVWHKNSVFNFQEINDSQPDIVIEFFRQNHGDNAPFDGPGGTLAHAYYPESGQVHFDDDEHWIFGKDFDRERSHGVSFFDTAVHELGHTLGLRHSKVAEAIMVPFISHDRRYIKLSQDEIDGLRTIYGARNVNHQHIQDRPRIPATRAKTTPPPTTTTETPRPVPDLPVIPDCCNTSYDALVEYRNELFIFKDEYLWRVTSTGIMPGYPVHTKRMWSSLPDNFKKIDAVYSDKRGNIVFFIGKHFYEFDASTLNKQGTFEELGIFNYDKIDAIFTWGKSKETFMFNNDHKTYWK